MYDLWILAEGDDLDVDGKWATEEELFKLATVVQHDTVPARLEAAYLFGNTPDLEESILARAAEIALNDAVDLLCLCGLGQGVGPDDLRHAIAYRGGEAWKHGLEKRGVETDRIIEIPQPDPTPHTGTEAMRFVEWCDEEGVVDAGIVVHPAHALRAFTSVVSAIVKTRSKVRAYVIVADDRAWSKEALYSQHGERKMRMDMIEGELDRLNRWHAKGDLVSAGEVIEYLTWRGF